MAAEQLPNPGSLNDFTEDLIDHGQIYETEDHYLNYYEFALTGMAREVARRDSITILQVHNADFIDLAA